MSLNYFKLACDLWFLLAVVWLFGLLTTKPDARTQSLSSRVLEIGLGSLAFSLVFTDYFRSGWTALSFAPTSNITGAVGLFLVLIGVSFAIWARLQLGGNWSAAVTVKQGHTLIRQGPYTVVRHPIYSGLLLSLLGVAVIVGEVRGLLGVGVFFLALWIKSSMEERFMLEEFGAEYRNYQQRVKALVPYIF
jgi:protein-S-isoprenylcysteine O-methyltransferase Ste14